MAEREFKGGVPRWYGCPERLDEEDEGNAYEWGIWGKRKLKSGVER